ncbi:MAG: lysophospholipid acyltransferase family protein [Thermodesulfobacteriota bacterium]
MRFDLLLLPRQICAWALIGLMTIIIASLLVIVNVFPRSGYLTFRIGRVWNMVAAWFMGVRFSLNGAEKIVKGESYVITPNHQGFAEILALFVAFPVPFKWVIKKELRKIPFFGRGLMATGAICLDRSNRESSVKSLQEGMKNLARGWSVLIYPEGTRTPDGRLQAFKKGAFMTAVQTGIPILPVTCNGAYKILPKKTVLFRPGHVTLTIGDPIPTAGLSEHDVPNLMERTWQAINADLNPDFDPFR